MSITTFLCLSVDNEPASIRLFGSKEVRRLLYIKADIFKWNPVEHMLEDRPPTRPHTASRGEKGLGMPGPGRSAWITSRTFPIPRARRTYDP